MIFQLTRHVVLTTTVMAQRRVGASCIVDGYVFEGYVFEGYAVEGYVFDGSVFDDDRAGNGTLGRPLPNGYSADGCCSGSSADCS